MIRILITFFTLVFLSGCAGYMTRKNCEKTNWFQHGQDVAMRGQNLENDPFINECRKADANIGESQLDLGFKKGRANYCEPETVYETGKKGEPLSIAMCDGVNPKLLRARHLEGVKEFCRPDNGEDAGATGTPYKKVCPKDQEAAFLKEFKKGRKKYLAAEVDSRELHLKQIDEDLRALERDRKTKADQLTKMGGEGRTITRRKRVNNGIRRSSVEEQVSISDGDGSALERSELKRDIDQIEWRIREKRDEQAKVREEMRKLRTEMLAL